jgi:AraC-like DNA-binding protein
MESKQMNGDDATFLECVTAHIENNLNTVGYSVGKLSRDLYMDRTGLYRKIILLTGISPGAYIHEIRMNRVAQLLAEGKLTISEVADKAGFNSSGYMSRCFVKKYGCRPSEYRKKMQNTGNQHL